MTHMNHRTITLTTLATAVCWLLGVSLVVASAFGWIRDTFGPLGILFVAFGHLVVLRADHDRLEGREKEAFELGRESVRSIR